MASEALLYLNKSNVLTVIVKGKIYKCRYVKHLRSNVQQRRLQDFKRISWLELERDRVLVVGLAPKVQSYGRAVRARIDTDTNNIRVTLLNKNGESVAIWERKNTPKAFIGIRQHLLPSSDGWPKRVSWKKHKSFVLERKEIKREFTQRTRETVDNGCPEAEQGLPTSSSGCSWSPKVHGL